ncbi:MULTISPECIES: HAMP domain-containing sensor histidine kinase [Brevibacillus]|jgi:NarL family two-component system sensor histidine kinase LiaS|uniref:Oxygen sensor histidine kinase NreB n=1 Tax=Brevibacillus parabrevis TaxID=54914 RepID=A0A4Y3PP74_BREPA|nr:MULTISPECIES: sensor histidine kinase [Brevibacillus]MBU8715001.1 sensor histidine kinase [Brevibacillus parabrevis]MDH6352323.1 NarL family two-component system sensor histidine kinase LiaS [Brevibacillus sp. 1238]MDR5000067.1 sensor histidine kinase [Brevibacillus parabrevis]MED2255236.1 sensor histidine kinase [Brevibacillus parabrevis]NRQ54813.1 sensor histidine kinase [Brevibacillus sp. HD1.4A]
MRRQRLASIQWQYVRYGVLLAASAVTVSFVCFFWLYFSWKDMPEVHRAYSRLISDPRVVLWMQDYLGLALPTQPDGLVQLVAFVISLPVGVLVALIISYIFGNLLKKRLGVLWEAAMKLGRGMLSYRVPDLGVDEVGELGWQLNRLASQWEEQVASLQRLSNHNAALAEQVKQAAVTEERQRLARELHDAVSQQLFAIAMTTAAMKRLVEKNPQRAAQQIELVEEMAAAAQAEMRALLLHLRPATLQNKSLKEAMMELLEELTRKNTMELTWEIEDVEGLPSGIEDHLFRILQESLSNTLRHAKASLIAVKLFTLQEQVRLRVTDDGVGFDPDGEKMTSYGLRSMQERVAEVGGSMEIYSAVGKGTQIEVRIPLMLQPEREG